ncbi:MAG: NADH-quinone oxidoreductase subunit [Thermoleophilaceae bacterium]|jgi:NADH-quinone oxidoreductase subunit L|nr:NADH-quinone oxidoreductase subunit [Thermoleophilaceae bacterium]
MSTGTWGWLILAFPPAGSIVVALGWQRWRGRTAGWLGTAAIALAFVSSIGAFLSLLSKTPDERTVVSNAFDYIQIAGLHVKLGVLVDPLSVFMCLVVSGVSMLIHVYSVAYMDSDRGYVRFFSYLNFFVFSMLLLILASNFVLLIVGWAFVGAASYLLISFWYRRDTAVKAGIKAFVMNVIGDVGLVVAAFLLFDKTGALDYATVFAKAPHVFQHNDGVLIGACLMLLVGAFAKSAQLPLHTWLPDAMEGPTPVSALIHAATMVTAGVYLIARMHPLFELAPTAADVAAITGTATLFVAGSIALVVTDLKRVIAYSTMSQIGYMVLGVASFGYAAGLFHLMTHAFFKALLFMGAGSVISAMGGVQNMDRMGGFRKAMPFTFATFTTGALALAGFPLLSGWFSKDSIIGYTFHRGGGLYTALGVIALITALMTAFYAFRMVFRTFFGEQAPEAAELEEGNLAHGDHVNPVTGEHEDTEVGFPGAEHHIAEREWPMRLAMAPLAVLSVLGGIVLIPGVTDWLDKFLEPTFKDSKHYSDIPASGSEWTGLVVGGAIALAGIGIAYMLYMQRRGATLQLRDRLSGVHDFLSHKWYFDELYDLAFVRPVGGFGNFGRRVIESRFVQGFVIGGAVGAVRAGTGVARAVQTGYIRAYALMLVIGVLALGLYFLVQST